MEEANSESEESVGRDGAQDETARRYAACKRRTLGKWYPANIAAETGKHSSSVRSIRSRKYIKKP